MQRLTALQVTQRRMGREVGFPEPIFLVSLTSENPAHCDGLLLPLGLPARSKAGA